MELQTNAIQDMSFMNIKSKFNSQTGTDVKLLSSKCQVITFSIAVKANDRTSR